MLRAASEQRERQSVTALVETTPPIAMQQTVSSHSSSKFFAISALLFHSPLLLFCVCCLGRNQNQAGRMQALIAGYLRDSLSFLFANFDSSQLASFASQGSVWLSDLHLKENILEDCFSCPFTIHYSHIDSISFALAQNRDEPLSLVVNSAFLCLRLLSPFAEQWFEMRQRRQAKEKQAVLDREERRMFGGDNPNQSSDRPCSSLCLSFLSNLVGRISAKIASRVEVTLRRLHLALNIFFTSLRSALLFCVIFSSFLSSSLFAL